jgi:P4 family phage/plasmid primase-like protien
MSLYSNENKNERHDIFKFLEEHFVEKEQIYTHTSIFKPKGSFFINKNELDIFYNLYDDALSKNIELHITERHEEISPIVIDIDFRYNLDVNDRKHNESHVIKIVELYINEILNLFNIEKDDKRLVSFVFERNELYKWNNTCSKDGIHILFPMIVSHAPEQYYIRENILKKISLIINDLEPINLVSDIVDRAVISNNNWLLYGSNKDKPKNNPYRLKYIYNGNLEVPMTVEDFMSNDLNLAEFFSIRNKTECDLIEIKEDKKHLLEVFSKKKIIKQKQTNNLNYELEKIRELVTLLKTSRADNFNQWIEVGWLLHNIDHNSQELLDIWIEFSKKSSKFKEGECEKVWANSKNEGFSLGTLHFWARNDNPQKYSEFKTKYIDIDKSISTQSNYNIATVLFKMYEYDFAYCDSDWYIYKNHRWNRENDGMSLRSKISTELSQKYINVISDCNKMACNHDNTDEEKEQYKKKSKEVLDIVTKLGSTSFKDNVMKECKELFYKKDFVKKLDTNPYLIGFENGVYDLKKGELREGRPDDYIEMNTEIEKIDFDEYNEHWYDLKKFIETVFYEEEMRTYFLTYLSTCLQGHNAEEKFRIWTGCGCHSKDTEIRMYDGCLKKVQDIIVGDKLMGDDLIERNVLELKRGYSGMYKIYGEGFDSFIVNIDHILCLTNKEMDVIYEISLDKLLRDKSVDGYYLYDKNNNIFRFKVSKEKDDNFYGFELDKNNRYEMGNGIITHNSNGKSKILELFVAGIGMYSIKFPVTMLTGKRAASNACTPEMARAKGKRFGYLEEPSENEKLDVGYLKELTGGDKITARALHKDPIDFKPQFKLSLLCNEIPKVPPNDHGTWRRMEVIEFKNRFCENPKEPNEFPIDNQLSEKLKNWKELFIALLLDKYYKVYKEKGLKVPYEVIKFTEEYQKQCDLYADFIIMNLEDTKNMSDVLIFNNAYEEFKMWYDDIYGSQKCPTKPEFKKYLKNKYGTKRILQTEMKGFKMRDKSIIPPPLEEIIHEEPKIIQKEQNIMTKGDSMSGY